MRGSRTACEAPGFEKRAGSTENSLIGAGRSLIVENDYGYDDPTTMTSAPTVVPELSLATRLVYPYSKPAGDPWYRTALDFRTGEEIFRVLAGAGPLFTDNYAGLAIGPDGTVYLGVIAGLVAVRDGSPGGVNP